MTVTIKPKNQAPATPSYADTLFNARALSMDSLPDDIAKVLQQIAHGQFNAIEQEVIIQAIQSKTKLTKKALNQHLGVIELELGLLPNDIALEVARSVRSKHFNNGLHLLKTTDGMYMRFTGTHWKATDKGELRKIVFEEANKVLHLFNGKGLSSLVSQAWSCLDDLLGTDQDVMNYLDAPLPVINVQNGELWINDDGSVKLTPHKPESRLTYCLPIEYDPAAICPKYDAALCAIFAKSNDAVGMIRHWHEFVGYAIQPGRNIPSYWLLIGNGANGKTRLLQTLQHLMGPEATLNDSIARFMRDRFNTAYLIGKLLFVDDDLTEGVVLDDGLLKQISEHKRLSARRAYGRLKQDFICRALPVMAGNSFPVTRDISHGMWRRAKVIPFDRVFTPEEQDTALFPSIWKDELPGVLNHALAGLKRLYAHGGQFDEPEDCIAAKHDFFVHANPLVCFLSDQCEEDIDSRIQLKDFRAAFKAWASEQGIKQPSAADNTLKRKLAGLGYKVSKVKGYETLFGVTLKSP